MTALEAYALAKKVAKSAVSGIKSLTVNGTTLIIETNDGNVLEMEFPDPRGVKKTEIDENNHLIVTYSDDTVEDAGPLPESEIKVTQILSSGIKIATIEANNITTELFAPDSDYHVINTLAERPSSLPANRRAVYYCIENNKSYLWDGTQWSVISASGEKISYNDLTNLPSINGSTITGNLTTAQLGIADGVTIIIDENNHLVIGDFEVSSSDIDALFD